MGSNANTAESKPNNIWGHKFSRRKLFSRVLPAALIGGSYAIFGATEKITNFAGERAISPVTQQLEDYNRSEVSVEDFLKENERLKGIKIGCSFSPEKCFEIQGQENHDKALKALKYIVEDLHIKDIRLGVRWSNVIDKNGKFHFDYYQKYFDYCLENGVNVCLNVGPIKTFRWPEIHLPKEVFETAGKFLPKKYEIKPTDKIAEKAFSYLNTLLFYLKTKYTSEQLKRINSIQAENEPFYPFGHLEWTSSKAYLKEVIKTIKFHFPEKGILVNSAGTFDLEKIDGFFKELTEEKICSPGQLTVGFDYYHQVEDVAKRIEEKFKELAKRIDKINLSPDIKDKLSKELLELINWFDIITASKIAPGKFGDINILKKLRSLGFKTEVTEAQMEEWGRYNRPGNSLFDLQYVILRCLDVLDPKTDSEEKSALRIWGVEKLVWLHLFGKPSGEQKKMLKLIPAINLLT